MLLFDVRSIQTNIKNPPCIHAQIAEHLCIECLKPTTTRKLGSIIDA
jgi:hypothetical protein